jgi:hypothetical protein
MRPMAQGAMHPTIPSLRAVPRLPYPDAFRISARPPTAPSATLEVRWIHRGAAPDAMIEWLDLFDVLLERREDRYLVDPSAPDLGIKIRDAVQLDLKAFRGGLGDLSVLDVGRGRLQLWEKWSFPLSESSVPSADALGWLTLEKTRRRRSFEVAEDVAVERPVDRAGLPGCSIEVTEIVVGEGLWWTLGFEATGGRETLERNLHATVRHVCRGPAPDTTLLDLRHSMSYLGWLLNRRGRSRSRAARTAAN